MTTTSSKICYLIVKIKTLLYFIIYIILVSKKVVNTLKKKKKPYDYKETSKINNNLIYGVSRNAKTESY